MDIAGFSILDTEFDNRRRRRRRRRSGSRSRRSRT